MAVYEWDTCELIGVNISKRFQAVANNDVSNGPPFTQVALDIKGDWAGFTAPGMQQPPCHSLCRPVIHIASAKQQMLAALLTCCWQMSSSAWTPVRPCCFSLTSV